jgi:hypothetical protein
MTKLRRATFAATVAALAFALSCSSLQSPPDAKPIDDQAIYGRLEMLNVTTTPKVDTLTFRGTFRNQFNDPVDGIRVVLRILQDPSPTSPELARAQKVLDAHLEPGAHMPFEITAKVRPASLANVGFFLNGFAVTRGGEELPISPLWK